MPSARAAAQSEPVRGTHSSRLTLQGPRAQVPEKRNAYVGLGFGMDTV